MSINYRILLIQLDSTDPEAIKKKLSKLSSDYDLNHIFYDGKKVNDNDILVSDLIVLTSRTVDNNTLEFLHRIHPIKKARPLIVVSDSYTEKQLMDMHQTGVSDFIRFNNLNRLLPAVHRELANYDYKKRHEISKHLVEATFENKIFGVAAIDSDGYYVMVNDAFSEMSGYGKEELIGNSIYNLNIREFHEEIREKLKHVIKDARIYKGEWPLIKKDGSKLEVESTLSRMNYKGVEHLAISFIQDISEEKKTQHEKEKVLLKLRERIKEQACLYKISSLNELEYSVDSLLGTAVKYLPDGWRHPEKMEAAITFEGMRFTTDRFRETDWMLQAESNRITGSPLVISVAYQEYKPDVDESPFIHEERQLIDSIADHLALKVDRIQAQERLKKKSELLEAMQKLARVGGWELDLRTKELKWTNTTREIHEVDPEFEPNFQSGISFYREGESREKIRKVVEKAINDGTPYDVELQIVTGKGNERWVRSIGEAEFKNGECVRLYGSFQDIHERKEAQKKLENLSDNIPGVIFQYRLYTDGSDELTYMSRGAKKLWGKEAKVALNHTEMIWKQVHPDDLEGLKESIQRSARELNIWNYEWRSHHPVDGLKWFEGIGTPSMQADGSVIWDSLILDITGEKEAEIEIERSRAELQKIMDQSIDIICTINAEGKFVKMSSASGNVWGYPSEELVGKTYKEFIYQDDLEKTEKMVESVIGGSEVTNFENRFRRVDGKIVPMIWSAKWDEDVQRLICVARDASEIKQTEEKLKQLNKALEKRARELAYSNSELEKFAYIASHDLQEPLRMVRSFLTKLEDTYGEKLDDKSRQYIHFAVDGANRMQQIIMDLLEYSRVGRNNREFEKIDMNRIMEDITRQNREWIDSTNAEIHWTDLPVIRAAHIPLRQLIQNLISNALKYKKSDTKPYIEIGFTENPDFWQFSVADNGIGIEEEYHSRIFEIFKRLHSREEYTGTGIGLAICKKIAETHSGKIWVESEPGQGSIFYFTIAKKL